MHRARLFTTTLCLLALWLQMMVPALAMSRRSVDPHSAICHVGHSERQDRQQAPQHNAPACDHCLLCHALAGGLPADGRPVFTLFDYPVVSPLRWASANAPTSRIEPKRGSPPRGPPILV